MSEEPVEERTAGEAAQGFFQRIAELDRWKKVLLVCALVSVVVGFALQLAGGPTEATTQVASDSGGPGAPQATSILPRTPTGTPTETPGETPSGEGSAGDWSPLFVKGGFSFFFGFCVGYALRAFFKVSAIALGVIFLALLGLQQGGFVEIHWDVISTAYDSAASRLSDEMDSIQAFLTGSLPSAALGGLGLFAGFKGNR